MKVPLKNKTRVVVPGIPDYSGQEEIKVFEYAHDEPLLGEIAGHVLNRYLRFQKAKSPYGERYELRFGSMNPNKAQLLLSLYVDEASIRDSHGRVKELVFEDAVEELLYKSFEAVDAMHKLDSSFFDRIKFAFKSRTTDL